MTSKLISALSADIITVAFVAGTMIISTQVLAASDSDKAALQQATATCRAEVKERARFHEMSWYARHKAVKQCIKETLAKH
jgi:hypothetical protein